MFDGEPTSSTVTPEQVSQIEADLQATLDQGLRKRRQTEVAEKRAKTNPGLAKEQADIDAVAASARAVVRTEVVAKSKQGRQAIIKPETSSSAPLSAPVAGKLDLPAPLQSEIQKLKEKFWTAIFEILPPSIGMVLSMFLKIPYPEKGSSGSSAGLFATKNSGPSSVSSSSAEQVSRSVDVGSLEEEMKLSKAEFRAFHQRLHEGEPRPKKLADAPLLRNPNFVARAEQIAQRIGCSKEALYKIMWKESNLTPWEVNASSRATGLIQFMPNTARALGTSVEALAHMDGVQQLDYVEKFYRPYFRKIHDYSDLYLATFYPAALGKPDDFVLGSERSEAWAEKVAKQNPGVSKGKGYATVADFRRYAGGEPKSA